VNWYGDQVKNAVEPCSPDFNSRFLAVRALYDAGVPVVPYVSPVLPWVTDIPGVLDRLAGLPDIEFEFLNGNLANFQDICAAIGSVRPQVLDSYKRLAHDRAWYEQTWKKVRLVIDSRKRPGTAGFPIYQHPFGSYFTNVYEKGKISDIEKQGVRSFVRDAGSCRTAQVRDNAAGPGCCGADAGA
jgi:DNA repair photolyase